MKNNQKSWSRRVIQWELLLVCLGICGTSLGQYGGGSGTDTDPYIILTADQLNTIGANSGDWGKCFILMADIDLSAYMGTQYNRIGINDTHAFTGVLDGNGHIISNLTYDANSTDYVGLVGYLGKEGIVKNLGLVGVNMIGGNSIGGLVGVSSGTMTNCYSSGSVSGTIGVGGLAGGSLGIVTHCSSSGSVSGRQLAGGLVGGGSGPVTHCHSSVSVSGVAYVGGLVGSSSATVANCHSSGSILGTDFVGGLVGWYKLGNLTECYSTSEVSGDKYIGGLIGNNWGAVTRCYSTGLTSGNQFIGGLIGLNEGDVTQCYSTSSNSGNQFVGGLVGYNRKFGGVILNSYSTGAVHATGDDVGGLIGKNDGIATASFWDILTSGQATSGGGTGMATAELFDIQTYMNAGWDLVGEIGNGTHEIWQMPEEGGYPALAIFTKYIPPELQGLGTAEDPYLISDAMELGAMIHYSPEACYRLAGPIDLTGIRWDMAVIPCLAGTFDGNGHTISHLTITRGGYLGLFGRLESTAEVRNLGVVDVNIVGSFDYAGALAGFNLGTVIQCHSTGTIHGINRVGGLVGSSNGNVSQCHSTGTVNGNDRVGGLIGHNEGSLAHCYSIGTFGGNSYVGGLVGENHGNVANCYSTGTINGGGKLGGLLGSSSGDVSQCYSTGAVSGNNSVGGFMGNNDFGNLTQCYSTGTVNGMNSVGGFLGSCDGDVNECYSTGAVSGRDHVGGLVGTNYFNHLTQCYSTSQVNGNDFIGGLIGNNYGTVTHCYSMGAVIGRDTVGGLVGAHYNSSLMYCYSTGTVSSSGSDRVGGLVGNTWIIHGASVAACFWDIQTSSQSKSEGGEGKTTAQMQDTQTYLAAGWDFDTIWTICTGKDYPRLWWENTSCEESN